MAGYALYKLKVACESQSFIMLGMSVHEVSWTQLDLEFI